MREPIEPCVMHTTSRQQINVIQNEVTLCVEYTCMQRRMYTHIGVVGADPLQDCNHCHKPGDWPTSSIGYFCSKLLSLLSVSENSSDLPMFFLTSAFPGLLRAI